MALFMKVKKMAVPGYGYDTKEMDKLEKQKQFTEAVRNTQTKQPIAAVLVFLCFALALLLASGMASCGGCR